MPELPKLSQVVKSFTAFEDQVEQTLSQTGFTPPPGPMKTLASFMEQFEAAAPQLPEQFPQLPEFTPPQLPEFQLPQLPEFKPPGLPSPAGTQGTTITKKEEGIDI